MKRLVLSPGTEVIAVGVIGPDGLSIRRIRVPQEVAAEKAGYSVGGSAYRNPRSHLRSLGLVELTPEGLKAKAFLFLE